MPKITVVFYRDEACVPVLEWLKHLPERIESKARVRIIQLAESGYELRRPEADYLGDGIYELRWRFQSQNFRILYFFHGRGVAVLVHGLVKEDRIPPSDMEVALMRKDIFESDSVGHSYEEDAS